MDKKPGGRTESHTVVRKMHIRDVADDLSEMTVEYQEPKAQGRRRVRHRRVGAAYVMADTLALQQLRLLPTGWRILMLMIGHMDRQTNEVRLTQQLIAGRAGLTNSAVSRHMPILLERNLIERLGQGHFRVSPWIAYAGEWRDWDQAAKQTPEPIWHDD
jgi:hypothetical protein